MMEPAPKLVLFDVIAHADPLVQVVVAALVIASIASWAIILVKIFGLSALRAAVARIEATPLPAIAASGAGSGLLQKLLAARDEEVPDQHGTADLRQRRVQAMRAVALFELRRHEGGLSFLATLASTAPFVGLFGTVWGIMQSFSSIAAAKDTSLAVVAPGIAEALFATAIGLGAAIPAVVAYNLFRAALARCNHRLIAAIQRLAKAPAGPG